MDNNQVTRLLTDFRSYEYAAHNLGVGFGWFSLDSLSPVIAERMRNPNTWDKSRYNRIVNMVKGAVEHVLSDDHKAVINRKYLDRNTLNLSQIATVMNVDRTTVSRWHKDAIRRLAIALEPLTADEMEINNIDHMFDKSWSYKEPAS